MHLPTLAQGVEASSLIQFLSRIVTAREWKLPSDPLKGEGGEQRALDRPFLHLVSVGFHVWKPCKLLILHDYLPFFKVRLGPLPCMGVPNT